MASHQLMYHQKMARQLDHIRTSFPAAVSQLARLWRRAVDVELQPLGLTEATWLALLHIARSKEAPRQKDLAFSLGLDSSSVVRLLDLLERAAYIERQEGLDRRAKTIALTPRGKSVVAQVEKVATEARRRLLKDIPDAELEAAYAVITRISEAAAASMGVSL
jgi:MarR family transcriptional regulator for hemolysin